MTKQEQGINVSSEHGLNPSIMEYTCMVCGEKFEDGIALFGKDYPKKNKDEKAPKKIDSDFKDCKNCKEKMKEGGFLIEYDGEKSSIEDSKFFRTGRVAFIKLKSWNKLFHDKDEIRERRVCFIDKQKLDDLTKKED